MSKLAAERKLLLAVAYILRKRIPEMAPAYQEIDIARLDEALAPWGSTIDETASETPLVTKKVEYRRGRFANHNPQELISYIDALGTDASELMCQCRDVINQLTALLRALEQKAEQK